MYLPLHLIILIFTYIFQTCLRTPKPSGPPLSTVVSTTKQSPSYQVKKKTSGLDKTIFYKPRKHILCIINTGFCGKYIQQQQKKTGSYISYGSCCFFPKLRLGFFESLTASHFWTCLLKGAGRRLSEPMRLHFYGMGSAEGHDQDAVETQQ